MYLFLIQRVDVWSLLMELPILQPNIKYTHPTLVPEHELHDDTAGNCLSFLNIIIVWWLKLKSNKSKPKQLEASKDLEMDQDLLYWNLALP